MPIKSLLAILLFSIAAQAQTWRNHHYISGCRIFTIGGVEKSFPGDFCVFLDDGRLISASLTSLKMLSPIGEILWEHKGHFHHQANLSQDKQRLLVLTSEVEKKETNITRQDKFWVLDLNGKILHEALAAKLIKEAGLENLSWAIKDDKVLGPGKEISHFNSFYEISDLHPNVKTPLYMKKGNVVINSVGLGTFVLSPDLQTVIHHQKFPNSFKHSVHDVQVTKNGNFLFFNNIVATKDTHTLQKNDHSYYSAINEWDPRTGKVVQAFEATPKEFFLSVFCGGIQQIDEDTWLFSHALNGAFVYSKKQKKLLLTTYAGHLLDSKLSPIQQIKLQDLSSFLKNWKL